MKEILEKILEKLEEINKNILELSNKIMNTPINSSISAVNKRNLDCGCPIGTVCHNTACPRKIHITYFNTGA